MQKLIEDMLEEAGKKQRYLKKILRQVEECTKDTENLFLAAAVLSCEMQGFSNENDEDSRYMKWLRQNQDIINTDRVNIYPEAMLRKRASVARLARE